VKHLIYSLLALLIIGSSPVKSLADIAKDVRGMSDSDKRIVVAAGNLSKSYSDFWRFSTNLRTIDQAEGTVRPFPTPQQYKYLGDLSSWRQANRVGVLCKSRQLFASYQFMAEMLWEAWRTDSREGKVYEAAIVSKRLDDAVTQFRRVKLLYRSLPEYMQVVNPVVAETTQRLEFANGGIIAAYPASESIGHSLSLSEVLLDEGARLPHDRQMWAGLMPTVGKKGRLYIISTPNGKFNLFHDLWHNTELAKFRLHYSMHPERGVGWKEKMRPIIDPTNDGTWEREQELNFLTMEGQPVYPGFQHEIHVTKVQPLIKRSTVMYRGLDWGFRHPACLWGWRNEHDQLCIVREHAPADTDIYEFLGKVVEISRAAYPGAIWRNFPDPAGQQRWQAADHKGKRSAIEVMKSFGMTGYEFGERGLVAGLDLVRHNMRMRSDHRPGILIDESCTILIEALQGGYHYPDRQVGKDEPFKDHWYDDVADCFRYMTVGLEGKLTEKDRTKQPAKPKTYVSVSDSTIGI